MELTGRPEVAAAMADHGDHVRGDAQKRPKGPSPSDRILPAGQNAFRKTPFDRLEVVEEEALRILRNSFDDPGVRLRPMAEKTSAQLVGQRRLR
mgnify:CR=1 FL=1